MLEGKYGEALAQIEESSRHAEELGPGIPREIVRYAKAEVLVALGRYAEARAVVDATDQFAREFGSDLLTFTSSLMRAWLALNEEGEARCAQVLESALAIGRARDYVSHIWWRSPIMARLCEVALRRDIEADYVTRLIGRRRLEPPGSAFDLDTWPRPIKIYTLGRFSVLVDGKPLVFSGKAQKRPLELLKALIALGARDVPEARLMEALWPDTEGDLAKLSLNAAIHRLRKLLGADALVLQGGKLALDARVCWVDLWSVERTLTALADARRVQPGADSWPYCARLVALYRGGFLERELDTPWLLTARERLRSRFVRELQDAATALRESGQPERAIQCAEKALEAEPLAEELYRSLIRAQLAAQRPAEALSSFLRCQRMLVTHLGLEPTAETQALVQGLGQAQQ
jgi:DNA-binding SARP family transcriptional activator